MLSIKRHKETILIVPHPCLSFIFFVNSATKNIVSAIAHESYLALMVGYALQLMLTNFKSQQNISNIISKILSIDTNNKLDLHHTFQE